MRTRLRDFVRRTGVPAAGIAIVDLDEHAALDQHDGPAAVLEVAGSARRGCNEPVGTDDAWHIGSCAKSLTAALYGRLVENGVATWSAPLPDLFGDLTADVHPGWADVTIDDLLTCRGGVAANPPRDAMLAGYADSRPPAEQRTTVTRDALATAPRRPGRFRYSNLGYTIAGAVIDRVAGRPFENALVDELLAPLGVTTSGFGPPPKILGHRPRLQVGAICLGRGTAQEADGVRSDNPALITPAGRLHLSLPDWARAQRLFLDGAGLLERDTLERLLDLPADGRGMSMGWADASRIAGVGLGMQGSNTSWAATAMMTPDRRRAALVVANDGRTSVLRASARLAAELATNQSTT